VAPKPIRKIEVSVCKVDKRLGLVFGYAIVCKVDGEDYYDLGSYDESTEQLVSDHISEDEMLTAVTDFMKSARVAKEMHAGEQRGGVLHSLPLTTDIAKALGITAKMTGWIVAMQPDPQMLARFESGELTGFSIGGNGHREVEAA
jgi:uncharacterized protein (UPF0264 family)